MALTTPGIYPGPRMTAAATKPVVYKNTLKPDAGGIYKDLRGNVIDKNMLPRYDSMFNSWAKTFSGMKAGDKNYDVYGRKLKAYGSKYGYDTSTLLKNWKDPNAQPVTNTVVQPQPQPQPQPPVDLAAKFANWQSPMSKALQSALANSYSSASMYEPQNFEGSPLYQFQKQKGLRDLERLMSARGLTNSGAEIEANSNFLNELNATEAEKQRQYAEKQADRNQAALQWMAGYDQADRRMIQEQLNSDLDRRNRAAEFEATRSDALRTGNMSNLLELLRIQSQNQIPGLAVEGQNKKAELDAAIANAIASATAANYSRGGGSPPPPAPYDTSGLDIASILMGSANNSNGNDVVNSILNSILGGRK